LPFLPLTLFNPDYYYSLPINNCCYRDEKFSPKKGPQTCDQL
jgi:hypothetical protein